MSGGPIQIEPLEIVSIKHKNSFSVSVIHVELFQYVTLAVNFFDENNVCTDRTDVKISGEDYSNWAADDNYVINYVINKLGLQVKPPVVADVTPVVTDETSTNIQGPPSENP
jgi:hypothetical protein